MQETQLPQWFISDWNDLKIRVANLETTFDHHLNNHHGGATRRHQVQDWTLKAGGGGGLLYLTVAVLKQVVGG